MDTNFLSLLYGEKFANDVKLFKDGVNKIMDRHTQYFETNKIDVPKQVYEFPLDSKILSIQDEVPIFIKKEINDLFKSIFF